MGTPTHLFYANTDAGRATRRRRAPVSGNSNDAGRRLVALAACIALVPTLSTAAPIVVEETAKIASPNPSYEFPLRVAVEGDTVIATGMRRDGEIDHYAAYLFRRQSNGAWVYERTLAETSCNTGEIAEDSCGASVAIRNGLAVVSADTVHVFQRASDGTWVAQQSDGTSGSGDAAVGTDTVATSESPCLSSARAFRKNAAGIWSLVTTFPGENGGCDPWLSEGRDIDLSAGNRLIVSYDVFEDLVSIYEPNATTWVETATLTNPNASRFGRAVAIDDARAFVSASSDLPIMAFTNDTGSWLHSADIVPPDSLQLTVQSIEVQDLVVASFSDPHRGGSVRVFQEVSPGEYEQVAMLVRSDSASEEGFLRHGDVDVNGSFARIAAAGPGAVYVFDLDDWGTTLPPVEENFEQGNAANWTPMAGSTFSVVASGGSNVYRQSSLAGDGGSFLANIDWTNQAIEADVKPTAFNGSNRWVGLAVRRTDVNNNYYVTLRQSNVLELKRIVDGAYETLATAPVPVTLNRTYRLRLEAIGTLLRAYVDGRLVAQAHDDALAHGHAGVRMYRASVDFDNIVVSQNPQLTLLDQRINRTLSERWDTDPGAWSAVWANDNQQLVQQDLSFDARAVARVDANDQIVQTRARADNFASGPGSRWFGLIARYSDPDNYYYITVRKDNTISLRKLVNGAVQVLDSAPLTVSAGTWYSLRLEAVGNSVRAYVNGNLLLEANDASHASGRYGLMMYKTAATYDDFIAWEL